MLFFPKLKSFFYDSLKVEEPLQPYSLHYELLFQAIPPCALEDLRNHIRQHSSIYFRLTIGSLKEQIPGEYIGILSVYYGETLEYREYLKLREVRIEERIACSGLTVP